MKPSFLPLRAGPAGDRTVVDMLYDYAIYFIVALLLLTIIVIDPGFVNISNFTTILTQSSTRIIFALGCAGIIVLGGTDLAAGRIVGFAGVVSASMLQAPDYGRRIFSIDAMPVLPLLVPILVAMLCAGALSVLHGFTVAKWNVPPFIASLGFQQIVFGLCSLYFNNVCGASPISGFDPRYTKFTQGTITVVGSFRISYIMLYAIVVIAVMWFVWNKTVLGKNMFAIGGNAQAAKVSGVRIARNMLAVYMIAGFLYGFGGFLEAGRTGSAVNSLGADYALDAIAACVVGGVSMRGGTGSVKGVVLGVIIFQIISYGLIYVGVSPDLQYVVKGLIIVFAVAIDTRKYARRGR